MRNGGPTAALLLLVLSLTACGTETAPDTGPPLGAGHQALKSGPQVLDLVSRLTEESRLTRLPKISITVPEGWFNFDGWAMSKGSEPTTTFVTFWDVDSVYSTPCRWKYRPMVVPGRGVDGLASVLVKQPLRKATRPVEVELGGFPGKYLEWSVPANIDFIDCDEGVFESWTARGWSSDRYQQAPGQVDRIWILNVYGGRLVVDASYLPAATAEDRAELDRVVDSIRFLD
jgi:hypothetical protein